MLHRYRHIRHHIPLQRYRQTTRGVDRVSEVGAWQSNQLYRCKRWENGKLPHEPTAWRDSHHNDVHEVGCSDAYCSDLHARCARDVPACLICKSNGLLLAWLG